jgi:hypothetical protein
LNGLSRNRELVEVAERINHDARRRFVEPRAAAIDSPVCELRDRNAEIDRGLSWADELTERSATALGGCATLVGFVRKRWVHIESLSNAIEAMALY